AVNAPRVPRTRLATSAANPVTFPVIAPTQLARVLAVAAVDSLLVAVVETKSATSAQRSDTSLVTALRLVDTEAKVVDLAATKADMAVADTVADVKVVKLATPAAVTVTCLVTAPKDRSATTAVKSVISPETAPPRPAASVLATSASNPATSRHNARTKPFP
ncbi:hypothetical protein NA56DRAFT_738273, partial [Hyaloscypha hepaticicola]